MEIPFHIKKVARRGLDLTRLPGSLLLGSWDSPRAAMSLYEDMDVNRRWNGRHSVDGQHKLDELNRSILLRARRLVLTRIDVTVTGLRYRLRIGRSRPDPTYPANDDS